MNDGIYHPQSAARLKAFEDGIQRLSDAVHAAHAQLILLTPPPFDPLGAHQLQNADAPDFSFIKPFANYDRVLGDYARWETSLPDPVASWVVDWHQPLNDYLAQQRKQHPGFGFTRDGIHPNSAGHLLMAQLFLRAMGVPVGGDDLEAELARINADPLFKAIRAERELRSRGWLSYVGYRRGKTVQTDSIAATEARVAALQAQADTLRLQAHP